MSDGAQRLLDVIDDPNALESFLGELTSSSELLPSAESVDNVVASLARSLEGDYEVDSPNETLFDTLDPSSNNLTDISQSYVPSDFENVNVSNANNHGTYSMGSLPNGDMSHQQQQELQNSLSTVITSGNEQYIVSSNQSTNSTSNITSNVQQQFSSANSNCDSSSLVSTSSNSQFIQHQNQQQIQLNQNQQLLLQNNGNNYIFNQDLMQKQNILSQSQQPQPTASLSSSNVESQNQLSNTTTSLQNMISVSLTNNTSAGQQIMTSSFQQGNEMSQQQGQMQQVVNSQGQQQQGNSLSSSSNSNSAPGSGNSTSASNELSSVGTNSNSNNVANTNNSTSNPSPMQQTQQFASTNIQQQTTTAINQLGQTVSLANVNVGGTQILTNAGNIVTAGQTQANILQQIQSANAGQSFITMDQALLAAGSGAFGGANLALVSAGGTPTYAVVPAGAQFLQNTLMAQAQAVQTLTKGPNGTYFQTSGGTQLVAASNVNTVSNVNVANTSTPAKPKQPPQLLPKPGKNGGNSGNSGSSTSSSSSETVSSSTTSIVTSSNSAQANTSTEQQHQQQQQNMVTQLFQQQQAQIQGLQNQVVVTSVANSMGAMMPQQQFTIGNTGLGQVVMSQNPGQQTQLTGTLLVNQYGQPILVPSASTASPSGMQFIIRPQSAQPQMLTIQAPSGIGTQQQAQQGKPIVRYVTHQMPQLAQTSGYGIQQIQTPSGPQWVAVRYPQPATTLATTGGHFTQIDGSTLIQTSQISNQQQQIQVQVQQQQAPSPLTPHSQLSQPLTPQTPGQPGTPQSHLQQPATPQPPPTPPVQRSDTNTPDSSSEPPPAKKSKSRAKPKKQPAKVCLDLEQLLKRSGIMDEDLTDDMSFGDFGFGSSNENGFGSGMEHSDSSQMSTQEGQNPVQLPVVNTSGKSKSKNQGASPKKSPSKSKKKKAPEKAKSPSPPPPPPPISKSKKKKGGNQKADSKTDNSSSSKNDVPKKLSSIDSVTATIMAVAAGRRSPTPPPTPPPPSNSRSKSTPKTKSPSKSKNSKAQQNQSPVTPSSGSSIPNSPASSLPQTPSSIHVPSPMAPSPVPVAAPVVVPPVGGSPIPNGLNQHMIPSSQSIPRVVQTIQLTPQNQQLLRNIQSQISRLVSLPKRNDREQVALQKLIALQQQVIATGIPVPNPSHLSNLSQSVNATVSAATLLAASAVSSSSAITAILGGTNALSVGGDSLVSNSPNCSASTSNVSVSQNNIISNTSTTTNVSSSTQKLPSLKSSPSSVPILCCKDGESVTPGTTSSVVTTEGATSSNHDISINFVPGAPLSNTGVPKVTVSNDITEPSSNGGPEENKENAMGIPTMVVASSALATATTTTNSLGQHHIQSYPSGTYRSAIDEKKAEEQRIANQKAEDEKRARWKKEEFEMLLKRDQQCVVKPDYEIPFCSKRDAVERLMKYHILRDRNDMNFEEFDADFGEKASLLLDKFHGMVAKHRSLLLKESMKEVGCAERVMLERMFVNEEKLKLEQDRLLVSQGEILELPPPPSSWVPKIQDMVEKEMKEMERDSYVNLQVQSAIDSIIGFGNNDPGNFLPEENDKIEYDSFGVPINNGAYNGMNNSSSADIDEAVRSILS